MDSKNIDGLFQALPKLPKIYQNTPLSKFNCKYLNKLICQYNYLYIGIKSCWRLNKQYLYFTYKYVSYKYLLKLFMAFK